MEEETIVRPAQAADADALSQFAERVFDEAFGSECDEGDMASYLNEVFSPEMQRAEIAERGGIVLLAEEASSKRLAGYLHIAPSDAPACVSGTAILELKRLYVDPTLQSRGIGKKLFDEGLARARAQGAGTVWLGVWESNLRAQQFYAREGFTRVGEHPFVLGSDTQTDWVMARPV
ncbi:MAG: GNAT family N-acetyltransferase [Acidobacteriota bacterium]|nr:GNAT family N-acetyltransferase [Acidobacteriota bacterium]